MEIDFENDHPTGGGGRGGGGSGWAGWGRAPRAEEAVAALAAGAQVQRRDRAAGGRVPRGSRPPPPPPQSPPGFSSPSYRATGPVPKSHMRCPWRKSALSYLGQPPTFRLMDDGLFSIDIALQLPGNQNLGGGRADPLPQQRTGRAQRFDAPAQTAVGGAWLACRERAGDGVEQAGR
jgi:hypothetical protein